MIHRFKTTTYAPCRPGRFLIDRIFTEDQSNDRVCRACSGEDRGVRSVDHSCGLTVILGMCFTGVYRAPRGMTAFVASIRLSGHTFHVSLMASVCSSSPKESEADMMLEARCRAYQLTDRDLAFRMEHCRRDPHCYSIRRNVSMINRSSIGGLIRDLNCEHRHTCYG